MIENNNEKVIGKLAIRNIKFNRTRNTFIIIAIVLSVSLLGVMSFLQSARKQQTKNQLDMSHHVMYNNVNEDQIKRLDASDKIDFYTVAKFGRSFESQGKMMHPSYYERDTKSIKTLSIVEGRYPEKLDEIALSETVVRFLYGEKNIGDTIRIDFLDGSEEFLISGFLETNDNNIFPVLFSKEYSTRGEQLKDVPYTVLCKLKNTETMSEIEFIDIAKSIGKDAGIEDRDINPNNFYSNYLSMSKQEIFTIVLVSLGVLFVSILVAYNIFYISVMENIQRFGQLRTIGTSKKQIKSIVRREGMILFSIGTPLGLLISLVISYWIIPQGWRWDKIAILCIIIAIAEFITIIISVQKPAKIASSISPVEASRFSGYIDRGTKETKGLYRKLSPYSMAVISLKRNRKKSLFTIMSLGIGGILFLMSTTMVVSTSLDEFSRQGMFGLGEYIISFDYNTLETSENGQIGVQLNNPINEELIRDIESISEVNEITKYHRTSIKYDYKDAIDESDYLSAIHKEDIPTIERTLLEGDFDYDNMVENDQILIARNDSAKEIYGWAFDIGDDVSIKYFDGVKEVERSFKIIGSIDYSEVTNTYSIFILPIEKLEQLFPDINTIDTLVISINDFEKEGDKVEGQLLKLIDENPLLEMGTLKEELVRDKESLDLTFKVIVGLSGFIILFSLINLVNTIISNIISRKKEFAMLQSIGLSNKQLVKMIQLEGLGLSFGNLVITLTLGTVSGYGLIRILQHFGAEYMHYRFPMGYLMIYILIIIMVPMIISAILVKIFKRESIISRLRDID